MNFTKTKIEEVNIVINERKKSTGVFKN